MRQETFERCAACRFPLGMTKVTVKGKHYCSWVCVALAEESVLEE